MSGFRKNRIFLFDWNDSDDENSRGLWGDWGMGGSDDNRSGENGPLGSGSRQGGNGGNGSSGNGSGFPPAYDARLTLSTHSFILGIASVVSTVMMTVFIPMILAPISVIFAVFSKGRGTKMPDAARRGLRLAVASLILNACIICFSLYSVVADPQTRSAADKMSESLYGVSLEDTFRSIDSALGTHLAKPAASSDTSDASGQDSSSAAGESSSSGDSGISAPDNGTEGATDGQIL
ncbi:MAG: hypothetical protein LKJ76_02820 [Lachnospiraceae bacterium]|jgi:hypothetical protein|nr:hypothetical protein [Lachnospiraceae bacterium]